MSKYLAELVGTFVLVFGGVETRGVPFKQKA
jgi:glycerol uptake facilitator-like aquaporin